MGNDAASRSQNRQDTENVGASLEAAREEFAHILNKVFARAKQLQIPGLSARRVAERWLGCPNERISKWRLNLKDDGLRNIKPMPAAAFLRLPPWIVVECFNAILRARGMKEYEP